MPGLTGPLKRCSIELNRCRIKPDRATILSFPSSCLHFKEGIEEGWQESAGSGRAQDDESELGDVSGGRCNNGILYQNISTFYQILNFITLFWFFSSPTAQVENVHPRSCFSPVFLTHYDTRVQPSLQSRFFPNIFKKQLQTALIQFQEASPGRPPAQPTRVADLAPTFVNIVEGAAARSEERLTRWIRRRLTRKGRTNRA